MTVTIPGSAALTAFVDSLDAIVRSGRPEIPTVTAVAEALESLVQDGSWLPAVYRSPNVDHYVMYPLALGNEGRWSVAAAVWNVGQSTPIHDHGTWGVVGILQGVEAEARYSLTGESRPEMIDEGQWRPGQVTVCCTTDADVHAVSCASDIPTVGIHVYGDDIGRLPRHSYDRARGVQKQFVSHWATPPGLRSDIMPSAGRQNG